MANKVPILSPTELAELHTGTLMARRDALLRCEESFAASDRACHQGASPRPAQTGFIEFKDTAEWKQAYAELKAVLAGREHIPSKAERKIARQAKAKARK